MRYRILASAMLAVPALLLTACHSGTSSSASGTAKSASAKPSAPASSAAAASQVVKLEKIRTSAGLVLANSSGDVLYWYAKDTPTTSACSGGCLSAWPPVAGQPEAAMGAVLAGPFGTITRANGMVQATYKNHPLYTYAGDGGPGQAKGNGVGGIWHVIMVSPAGTIASVTSPSSAATSGSGGGGGY